jgi:hypothetical protein
MTHQPQPSSEADIFLNLPVPEEWFLEKRIIDSLHGLRHLRRTAHYGLCLAAELNLGLDQTKLVAIAALLHDIHRQDDKGDPGHAARSAQWFLASIQHITQTWKMDIDPEEAGSIAVAISLHETAYEHFSASQNSLYSKHKLLVDVIKTADALDRYRLPKLTWWIDDRYLRIVPSGSLKQLAYEIVLASEKNFLQGQTSFESVSRGIETVQHQQQQLALHWANAHIIYNENAN